jgi:hypothetical protein
MLGQDGVGALRHGSITDEQNFVFKFQHGKNILARHFVRIFFALQEFIEKRTPDVESDSGDMAWLAADTCGQKRFAKHPQHRWCFRTCCGLGQAALQRGTRPATGLR